MKPTELAQNMKLGIFVVVGLILFLVAVIFIGKDNNLLNRTFSVSAVFKNVEGLKKGDNVWLSGVKIGTVKSVVIITESKVVVNLSLRDKHNRFIHKNATASIGSDGFIGNKIVVVRPGNSPVIIQEGDTINALSPADTQELLGIAKDVGENTKALSEELKAISFRIRDGKGILGELLNEGPFSADIRRIASTLRATGEHTNQASSDLAALIHEARFGHGVVATLISDTTFAGTFAGAVRNIRKVSEEASRVAVSLDQVVGKVNDSHNALGVLLTDTAFANKLQRTVQHAESASQKLDQDMEALKHNFLLRGYFRKQEKKEKKEKENSDGSVK